MLLKKNSKRNSRRNSRKNSRRNSKRNSKRNSRRNIIRRNKRNIKSANRRSNKITKNRIIKNIKTKKIGGQDILAASYRHINNVEQSAENHYKNPRNIEIDGNKISDIKSDGITKRQNRINFIKKNRLNIDQEYNGKLQSKGLFGIKKHKDIKILIKKINEPNQPNEEIGNRDFYLRLNLRLLNKNDRLKIKYSFGPKFEEEIVLNFNKIIFNDKKLKIIFSQDGNTSQDKTVIMTKGFYKLFKNNFKLLNQYLYDFYKIKVITN